MTLYMGNPKAFEVIGKTAKTSDTEVYTATSPASVKALVSGPAR